MLTTLAAMMVAVIFPTWSLLWKPQRPTPTPQKASKKAMAAFNLPSWGAGNAPAPGAPTNTNQKAVQYVALAMISLSFVGALVVMVVDYITHGDVALPSVVSAILFFGLGFVTHALGNQQGAATAQSSAATGAAIQQAGQATGAATATTAATTVTSAAPTPGAVGGGAL